MESVHSFKKEWWISGGILLGSILITAAALYFLLSDLAGQAQTIMADRGTIAEQNAVLSNFAVLKSDAVKAAPYMSAMQELLPTHDALIGFPSWMNGVAAAHNVSVTIAFQGSDIAATASMPGSDGFSMSAMGAESDLVAFINDLENQAQGYLISIDSFELVNQGGSYRLSAQGRVFSQ